MIALPVDEQTVYVGWRMLDTDVTNVAFDLYRQQDKATPVKLNEQVIVRTTDFMDDGVDFTKENTWILKDRASKEVGRYRIAANVPLVSYISIPLQKPEGGVVEGVAYEYTANDCSVADLDGDGEYEIILKWEPTNSSLPPRPGFTGNTIIDAYKLDGTLMWRIDLGKNIRSGAAYTQFLVYDFDGCGRAEMIVKTGDGTRDGRGNYVGDRDADWRRKKGSEAVEGKIIDGPEYLTVFDGTTGKILDSVEYVPTRYPLDGWGGIGGNGGNDNTGGRPDRFSACVAYLGGNGHSAVMVRGWYGRTVLAAWDYKDGKLTSRWVFDSALPEWEGYSGMANHSVTVADFDGDGFDEICVGAMTVDHDGKGLLTTGLRHGDALHAGKLIPFRTGLQVFGVHESEGPTLKLQTPGLAMFDGKTGEIIWSKYPGVDVGRGVAFDVDPRYPGVECWGGPSGLLRGDTGEEMSKEKPNSCNFAVWWDADPLRELLDKTTISKWDWNNRKTNTLLQTQGVVSNNGTKATPCLSADILGDWREEVIWRTPDSKELRIYSTTIPAINRMPTLMHDHQYRMAIVWQNVAYNQPPHPSFDMVSRFTESKISAFDPIMFSVNWTIEAESKDTRVNHLHDDTLEIISPKGLTLWWNEKLEGNVKITYQACVMDEGKVGDRLSDINCFWMMQDPEHPDDIFNRQDWRNGVFGRNYSLNGYYLGYGGNGNTTTRFRRYDGNFEDFSNKNVRPDIITEYTDKDHLLKPNHWYNIRIVCRDERMQCYIDDKLLIDYTDKQPYTSGWFGFRTTESRVRLKDFSVKTLEKTSQGNLADKPLFVDPVYDGAADPVVIWNRAEKKWFMLYTNRRANARGLEGVSWVHGTAIGIAESSDGGATWQYRGTCDIDYRPDENPTYWAPDVVYHEGLYHMYLTYVPGVFTDWNHPRRIVHLTSTDLIHWDYQSVLQLASDRVIDASVFRLPNGTWRMYYNNERNRKTMYSADSPDLYNWTDSNKRVLSDDRGEGAKVFHWKDTYWMLIDAWDGLAIYSSPDLENWTKQSKNILREPGTGKADGAKGQHCDVVVNQGRAFVFYFVHQNARITQLQVAELEYDNGELKCDRNKPVYMNLQPE